MINRYQGSLIMDSHSWQPMGVFNHLRVRPEVQQLYDEEQHIQDALDALVTPDADTVTPLFIYTPEGTDLGSWPRLVIQPKEPADLNRIQQHKVPMIKALRQLAPMSLANAKALYEVFVGADASKSTVSTAYADFGPKLIEINTRSEYGRIELPICGLRRYIATQAMIAQQQVEIRSFFTRSVLSVGSLPPELMYELDPHAAISANRAMTLEPTLPDAVIDLDLV